MRVTLADVISLDGRITKGNDPDVHAWSSAEDWEHFLGLRDAHDVIVIDRHTFETVRPPAEPGKLRVVMTDRPQDFAGEAVPGQLEFASDTPQALIERLQKVGYHALLVAGQGEVCSGFLAAGVVDELYLTLEPVLFGTGKPMLADRPLDVSLQLKSINKLNGQGTLLAYYEVLQ